MNNIIFAFILLLSLGAYAGPIKTDRIIKSHIIHNSLGEFNFELINLESRPFSDLDENRAEIKITTLDGKPIQKIQVEIAFSRPDFDFVDLNDDGYADLLLYFYEIPNGSIPVPEVYLYIPKLKKFVESKTLSGRGEISKSKKHGCVNVIFERNINGYIQQEWCFNLEIGRWKIIKESIVTMGEQ